MNSKSASAVRRKVSWLIKGKLTEFIGGKDCPKSVPAYESTVVENVLLYWARSSTIDGPTAMVTGYECGEGGIGRCLFCAWWVSSNEKWELKLHAPCPSVLDRELDILIWEVNHEEEEEEN